MQEAEVVVLGGGFAGLACASELVRLDLVAVVLEARPRLGGRICTLHLPDEAPIELGAQVIHGLDAPTWDVVRASGTRTDPLARSQQMLVRVTDGLRPLDSFDTTVLSPWEAAERLRAGHAYDVPVREALAALGVCGIAGEVTSEWLRQFWSGNDDLSAAGVAHWHPALGGAADQFVVTPGYDALTAHLADGLDVHAGSPVSQLTWRQGHVEAQTPTLAVRARAAVLAIPPAVIRSGGLSIEPALPQEKTAAGAHLVPGDGLVVAIELAAPARESTHVLAVDHHAGVWQSTAGSCVVTGVVKGPRTTETRALVRDAELERLLADLFPWYRAGSVSAVHVADWGADRWSRGAYTYPRVGAPDAHDVWAAPVASTLFFAGEATCSVGGPAMAGGALNSGRRAAREIADVIG